MSKLQMLRLECIVKETAAHTVRLSVVEPTYKNSESFDGSWVLGGVQGYGLQHLQGGHEVGLGVLEPAALLHLKHQLFCQSRIGQPAAS